MADGAAAPVAGAPSGVAAAVAGSERLVDDWTAAVFPNDAAYYALLVPSMIPVLIFAHFLIWFGHEFFVNN